MPTFKNEVTAAGQVGVHGISKTKHGVVGEAKQDGSGLVGISDLGTGVSGTSNSASGVVGQSDTAPAVRGISKSGRGVEGVSQTAEGLLGLSESGNGATGISRTGHGVLGQSENASGVRGLSRTGRGIEGWSETAYGVSGDSATSAGVRGTSQRGRGVEGWSTSAEGVFGICEGGIGVYGVSGRSRFFSEFVPSDVGLGRDVPALAVPPLAGPGQDPAALRQRDEPAFHHLRETGHEPSSMHAEAAHVGKTASAAMERSFVPGPGSIHEEVSISGFHDDRAGIGVLGEHRRAGIGVKAMSDKGFGLAAYSTGHEAIHAETRSRETAAIAAYNLNPNGTGAAIFAMKEGRRGHAGFFIGNVWITGELGVGGDIMLANADCAEDFDVVGAALAEPGTVMVMGVDGLLVPCDSAYDKRVAGVISGAGHFKPGVILDKRETAHERRPVALLGKVFCKATTGGGAIQMGDLLTTSDTAGHAMRAGDPHLAFGAVIGKALGTLEAGDGLIPILVALQ
jgi:hypothetical protein